MYKLCAWILCNVKKYPSCVLNNNLMPFRIYLRIRRHIWLLRSFTELAFAQPLRIICLSTVGHSTGSRSALWAIVQILDPHHETQCGISLKPDKNQKSMCIHWLCFHLHVAVYPCGHVHIHMLVAVYLSAPLAVYPYAHSHVSTCMWLCIHLRVAT